MDASFDSFWAAAVNVAWGLPLVVTLGLGGAYFSAISRLAPLRHAFALLSGRYDRSSDLGEISHFRALSAALSGTIGMGNIAGVAIAITAGGAGAVFWMWVAGALGMATKFFTCTLSYMHRKPNENGVLQGGPMYYIDVGFGRRYRPLSILFAGCGMVGCLGVFQSNQLASLLTAEWSIEPAMTGVAAILIVGSVVLGGAAQVGRRRARGTGKTSAEICYETTAGRTGLFGPGLFRPQCLSLLPTDDRHRTAVFLDELQRPREGHVEFTVLGEIGLVVAGVTGLVAIPRRQRRGATVIDAAPDFHFSAGQQIFARADVNMAGEGGTLRAIEYCRPRTDLR